MKVNIDYTIAHTAIEKLAMGDELKPAERGALLEILAAAEGDIIPTKEELERQRINIALINAADPDSEQFKRLMAQCTEFENKYC
jgi:hypothetical protein